MDYYGFFVILHLDRGNSFQDILEKEEALCASSIWKRRKFSNCILRWHSGSHAIAWAAITTSVCKVSYDLQIRRGIVVHAFYNIFENGKK